MNKLSVKKMRKLLGMSQDGFSRKYGIPKRTIENWESGDRQPPEYVLDLLRRAVMEDYEDLKPDIDALGETFGRDMEVVSRARRGEATEQEIIDCRFL